MNRSSFYTTGFRPLRAKKSQSGEGKRDTRWQLPDIATLPTRLPNCTQIVSDEFKTQNQRVEKTNTIPKRNISCLRAKIRYSREQQVENRVSIERDTRCGGVGVQRGWKRSEVTLIDRTGAAELWRRLPNCAELHTCWVISNKSALYWLYSVPLPWGSTSPQPPPHCLWSNQTVILQELPTQSYKQTY